MTTDEIESIAHMITELERLNQQIGEEAYKIKTKNVQNGSVLTGHINAALNLKAILIETINLFS